MDLRETMKKAGTIDFASDLLLQMVPQTGAKLCEVTDQPRHISCWDYAISPTGEHYFSVCAEGTTSDYARLYRYFPDTNEVKCCFRLEDETIVYPEAIRPSKVHSSLCFLPDGRVMMATHTTAAAPQHPRWMPFAYYPDIWEGFPGSNLLIYNPETGYVENLGIPVPHESIYGGTYEPTTDSFYFSGYHRGHIYRYDLQTRRVTDFGQATEFGTWRYIPCCDGNLYTTTATGRLVRINIKEQRIEDVAFDFPIHEPLLATGSNNKVMHYAPSPRGFYFTALSCQQLMHYDAGLRRVELLGNFVPEEIRDAFPRVRCMGMAADDTGRLWLLETVMDAGQMLVSITVDEDGLHRRIHGMMGAPQRMLGSSFNCFIRDGVLYASDTNRGECQPAVFQVPLETLLSGEPGPYTTDVNVYLRYKDGEDRYRRILGRELVQDAQDVLTVMAENSAKPRDPAFVATMPRYFRENPNAPYNGDSAVNATALPSKSCWVCKLWKDYGKLDIEAVGFDSDNTVWVQAGERRLLLKNGLVVAEEAAQPLPENAALAAVQKLSMPYQAERRHLTGATAACELSDGRILTGTADGMLAMIRGSRVFSMGSVGLGYTVHQIAAFPCGKRALGVAGRANDLGMVFTYDDELGLILHGRIFFQDINSPGVLGVSHQPHRVAVSPDGKYAAIAVDDRMSCVYMFELDDSDLIG